MTKFKRLTALALVLVICLSLFTLIACQSQCEKNGHKWGSDGKCTVCGATKPDNDKEYVADPETRPLTMSIQKPDGLFNPFFSTSAMDSTVIGMTQIGMLTSTADGQPKWGDDEPVVVKDYKSEPVTVDGKTYTDYSFIIKNGIKFSSGEPLTIKDVLFNLYLYLDPAYTGSSTIYSTDIVGLQAYRQQDPYASAEDASAFEDSFIRKAAQRLTELITFVRAYGIYSPNDLQPAKPAQNYSDEQIKSYWELVGFTGKEFRQELISDWNNVSLDDSFQKMGFTATWQVYLAQEIGEDFYQKNNDGTYWKDPVTKSRKVDPLKIQAKEAELDEYLADLHQEKNPVNIQNWAINGIYELYFPCAVDIEKGEYNESIYDTDDVDQILDYLEQINAQQFTQVANSWATATILLNQLIAEAKSEQFSDGAHPVKTITGITSSACELDKVTKDFSGADLGEPHDILKIRINDIDPKAVWNFAFNVAPMYYYSGTYEGHNYIEEFDAKEGNFGFKFGDDKFFTKVVNEESKTKLPVGAGVYMASTVNGGVAKNGSQFNDGSIIYFERNPNFETLGSGINNANIKYFRYKITDSDQVLNAISNGEIDVGEPNATPDNVDWLDSRGIDHVEVKTAGYGYVGINPRFVPDVNVRRAIMKAMNRQMIKNNYYYDLCSIIERPMSEVSWAFPEGATVYATEYEDVNGVKHDVDYKYLNDDVTGEEIETMLKNVGYTRVNGVYQKYLKDGTLHRLSYKFTIAGQSTDHPAYSMFIQAQNLLNDHGFDITVVTSQSALSDLSSGKLAVWAAAWSSTIDPDMYQVYHKDSNATSVNNWGYPQIKANATLYSFEQGVIEKLSKLIEQGRETDKEGERKAIYALALDQVMELAVELPTYQRSDMTAYNGKLLDRATMTAEPSPYEGLLSRIWELNYLEKK